MATLSPTTSSQKPFFSRYTSAPSGSPSSPREHSRDSPSSSCSSPDRSTSSSRRESFGSIKEDVDGIAQSFVDTHIEDQHHDHTNLDGPRKEEPKPAPPRQDMQQTPDFCCPCGGFLGWKQIRLGGKSLSRSYGDLRALGNMQPRGWAWEPPNVTYPERKTSQTKQQKPRPGSSAIEKVPPEVLDQIISNLALDVPPNGYTPRNVDLISCLLTSHTFHAATLGVLYRNMTFPHSVIFSKALNHMSQYPALGTLVRRLDFSHFTSVGLGRTKQMNVEIQNLTSKTLLKCLDLLPNLKECLLQEHLEGDISMEVLQKLFQGLPNLRAVDFCGCSSQAFSTVFMEAVTTGPGLPLSMPNLKRVSLHECSSLPAAALETLLPRLVNLTHLDLTHTQITDDALFSIPETANVTHLSLSRCTRLRGRNVVRFLTTHPAVCDSLVYLNLLSDPTRYRLLEEEDVTALLPHLPSSLRSLNLGGARIRSANVPDLLPLTKHLEELGLASADLSAKDINAFFTDNHESDKGMECAEHGASALRYLDLTKVAQITLVTLFSTSACLLLSQQSYPLQVIEFSDKIISPLRERSKNNRSSTGWTVREIGRRGWYVRDPASMPSQPPDDGSRSWKVGARWWGMRKIPVAVGDVGGIYGHYMFKK